MNNVTLELVMPVPELNPQQIMSIFNILGATSAGNAAVADLQYGKGARQVSLIEMREVTYTWAWDGTNSKLSIQPYGKKDADWAIEEAKVTVRGLQTGDTVLFKTEEDAKAWLIKLSSIEQLKLTVQTAAYNGTAVMYLSDEYAKGRPEAGRR